MRGKYVTETLRVEESGIARAAETLRAGGLVAVPTETVYGLAARADSEAAVADIYAAKGRPSFNPLIVHVASLDAAREFAEDVPLAAPSANRSGYISPTSAAHVLASLDGRIQAVLDGGECERGLESTIAAVRGDGTVEILRPGPVELDAGKGAGGGIEAPGQLASHYAPGKPVRLMATQVAPDDFVIGFGDIAGDCSLSESGDLAEAAARLYACLHLGARSPKPRIAVAPIPAEGIGIAINDRLQRAATPPDQSSSGS